MNATTFRFIVYIFIIALIDQISKYLIIFKYQIDTVNLNSQYLLTVNDYLNFVIIWNKGYTFGLFQNDLEIINNITIVVFFIIFIYLFFIALNINKKSYYIALSLIIGGGLGNVLDRIQYSAVIDFIDLHYGNYHWYAFNFADISVTLGGIFIFLLYLIEDYLK